MFLLNRLKKNPQSNIAIEACQQILKLDPDDKDARFNQEYVKKKLEALKKKQKQNNQIGPKWLTIILCIGRG